MQNFYLNLICIGFGEQFFDSLTIENLRFHRKGDIWRKRTGQKYKDNIAKLSLPVDTDNGYGATFDHLKEMVESEITLLALLQDSREIEVQFSASLDDENHMPHLHLTVQQIEFLLKINAEIDIHIS